MNSAPTPIVGTAAQSVRAACLWANLEDTQRFAAALALQSPLRNAFVALQGDLGAGKTSFVRLLLQSLGVQGHIKSPTYAVVEPHEVLPTSEGQKALSIWHFDFYRFNDPLEWEDAGFRDLFASEGLKLAEWPEKAHGMLPIADLHLSLTVLPDQSRQVQCQAMSERGKLILLGLQAIYPSLHQIDHAP